MEYWLISVPNQKNPTALDLVTDKLVKQNNIAFVSKFNVPQDFKVGTLDVLVNLSDELSKLDTMSESLTHKMAQYMYEILEDERDKLMDYLNINDVKIDDYVAKFNWDQAKFSIKHPLEQVHDNIASHLTSLEEGLKSRSQEYNQIKGTLQTLERKQIGSLLTRNIGDLVKKEQFVLDSEYLATLVVVVPRMYYNLWVAKYESLTDYVVPRSTEKIFEDNEHGLWTVTVFRKIASDYILKAKENRFFVRDFSYNESEIKESRNEITRLETDKKKQFTMTFRWLKNNFADAFIGLLHIKSLRVFVESVLRFGLPVNFQSILIRPQKKSQKKCRDLLNQMFASLENSAMIQNYDGDEIPGLNMMSNEYYPYVYYKLDTNYAELHR